MNESKDLSARLASMTQERLETQQQPEAVEEQIPQEASADIEESQEASVEQPETVQPEQPVAPKEGGHFKKLRESLERSEREKEQLYELLLKMQHTQQPVPTAQKPYEPELEENDFVPRTYVDRRLQETQQQVAQYQQVVYEQMVQNQLRSKYNDFETVVSRDNIVKLRQEHPEIAASLAANPDIAAKAQATYTIIKKLGLDTPEVDYEPIKQKIQANAQKPRPAVASPLSMASAYDYQRMSNEEMRREREAMEQAIRG